MKLKKRDALVVVDVQNDFAHPDGSLYVPGAMEAIPTIVEWLKKFEKKQLPIFLTMDWHPTRHISFDTWPEHCVQSTWGAEIHEALLDIGLVYKTVFKGVDPNEDQYSGFAPANGLGQKLNEHEVKRIFVVGLATDYCVKATVLDGLDNGFEVVVVSDGIAGVNVNPGDVSQAIKEMEDAGAVIL